MVLKWAGVFQEFSPQVSYSIKCTTVYKVWWLFSEFFIFLAVLHVGFLENK